jgi:hypothetical protein
VAVLEPFKTLVLWLTLGADLAPAADLASSRLQAILNACLIHRKKDSVLDGKKLIELPSKDVILRKLTFTQDEQDIYDMVRVLHASFSSFLVLTKVQIEKQSKAIINKYLRAGTILKVSMLFFYYSSTSGPR